MQMTLSVAQGKGNVEEACRHDAATKRGGIVDDTGNGSPSGSRADASSTERRKESQIDKGRKGEDGKKKKKSKGKAEGHVSCRAVREGERESKRERERERGGERGRGHSVTAAAAKGANGVTQRRVTRRGVKRSAKAKGTAPLQNERARGRRLRNSCKRLRSGASAVRVRQGGYGATRRGGERAAAGARANAEGQRRTRRRASCVARATREREQGRDGRAGVAGGADTFWSPFFCCCRRLFSRAVRACVRVCVCVCVRLA